MSSKGVFKLLFFGRLRDISHNIEETQAIKDEILSIKDLTSWLDVKNPILGKELVKPFVLVSVNKNIVKNDFIISEGDEVAFLPPVTGG